MKLCLISKSKINYDFEYSIHIFTITQLEEMSHSYTYERK